ncbi:MAG: lytic transglycosylase domain-containing protein [Schwartzia sp.]|nr:lytic transglycosylase domain-containing protein [Schwartzia sp. (in: firmicutes)]
MRNERYKDRKYKAVFFALLAILFAFAVYLVSQFEPVKKKYIYPYPHQELVTLYAEANGVSPALVASVIMHESKFADQAHSPRGAVGLMQLMPETAEWIAGQLGEEDFSLEKLREPEMNIRYGTWYLAHLEQEFDGNQVLTLAAYNAGRGTVHEWMEERGWAPNFNDISAIPYPETRFYVARVLKDRKQYETLYHPTDGN